MMNNFVDTITVTVVDEYNADQPRDDHGMWDGSGGSGGSGNDSHFNASNSSPIKDPYTRYNPIRMASTEQENAFEVATSRYIKYTEKVLGASTVEKVLQEGHGLSVEKVDPTKIISSQQFIHANTGKGATSKEPVILTELNGVYLVEDGNHRAAAALLKGTKLSAKVIHLVGTTNYNLKAKDADMSIHSLMGTDAQGVFISQRVVDEETGFLTAPVVLGRVGTQTYRAGELGIKGMDAARVLTLLRPAEEVFAPASVASWEQRPVTVGHPAGNWVDKTNWRQLSVGDVHAAAPAPEAGVLNGRAVVKDSGAIQTINQGKHWLSGGYSFDLDLTPGTYEGVAYDGVQRNIRGNHQAIVDNPRGGPVCKIADAQGDIKMRTITVDSLPVQVDEASAPILERFLANVAAQVPAKVKVGDESYAAGSKKLQVAVDSLVQENKDLKAKVTTPEQVAALVQTRVTLVGDAKTLVPDFATDGKDNATVQREVLAKLVTGDTSTAAVVSAIVGDAGLAKASEQQLAIAFAVVKASGTKIKAADQRLAHALTGNHVTVGDAGAVVEEAVDKDGKPIAVGRAALLARHTR